MDRTRNKPFHSSGATTADPSADADRRRRHPTRSPAADPDRSVAELLASSGRRRSAANGWVVHDAGLTHADEEPQIGRVAAPTFGTSTQRDPAQQRPTTTKRDFSREIRPPQGLR